MPASRRKDDILASNLYLAGLAVGYLLHIAQVQWPLLKLLYKTGQEGGDHVLVVVMVGGLILLLALLGWAGFTLRTGNTWAKVILLLHVSWRAFVVLRAIPSEAVDLVMLATNLTSLGLQLGAASLIIKQGMTRPAEV